MNLDTLATKYEEIIFLSLQEEYFNEMIVGEKLFEYRKKYRKTPTLAIIYISKTLKKMAGVIEFGKPIIGTAEELHHNIGAPLILSEYFGEGMQGFAIPIKKVYLMQGPTLKELQQTFDNFVVPQSYHILHHNSNIYQEIKDLNLEEIIVH